MAEHPEPEDLHAALEARRELGPDYEPQVVESFLARVERQLQKQEPPPLGRHTSVTPLALGSIALGIPVTAVALSNGKGAGGIVVAIIAWIAIAIVNLAASLRRH